MEQMPFDWAEHDQPDNASEVELDPETTEAVIALMARVLVALLRAIEEGEHEW